MSEHVVAAIMEGCKDIAFAAGVDAEVLWRALAEARPNSALSDAVEQEIELRAIRRSQQP